MCDEMVWDQRKRRMRCLRSPGTKPASHFAQGSQPHFPVYTSESSGSNGADTSVRKVSQIVPSFPIKGCFLKCLMFLITLGLRVWNHLPITTRCQTYGKVPSQRLRRNTLFLFRKYRCSYALVGEIMDAGDLHGMKLAAA
jgi:hypothetical protein